MNINRPCGVFNEAYEKEFAIIRTRAQWGIFMAFLATLFVLPLATQSYIIIFLTKVGISLISALGLSLLMGYCGLHLYFWGI